jgi:hypothetical protein
MSTHRVYRIALRNGNSYCVTRTEQQLADLVFDLLKDGAELHYTERLKHDCAFPYTAWRLEDGVLNGSMHACAPA